MNEYGTKAAQDLVIDDRIIDLNEKVWRVTSNRADGNGTRRVVQMVHTLPKSENSLRPSFVNVGAAATSVTATMRPLRTDSFTVAF